MLFASKIRICLCRIGRINLFVNFFLDLLIKQFSYRFIDAVLLDFFFFFFNGQEVRERIFKGSSETIGIVYKTQVFNK